jgi:hypothetical protein
MNTTKNFKTIYLDFAYDTDTFAESLYEFRKVYPYAVVNPTGNTANGWPIIEAVVPADMALQFLTEYHGGDVDQAMEFMED